MNIAQNRIIDPRYKVSQIKKSDGKMRTLTVPNDELIKGTRRDFFNSQESFSTTYSFLNRGLVALRATRNNIAVDWK